jgi:hypothetical protein
MSGFPHVILIDPLANGLSRRSVPQVILTFDNIKEIREKTCSRIKLLEQQYILDVSKLHERKKPWIVSSKMTPELRERILYCHEWYMRYSMVKHFNISGYAIVKYDDRNSDFIPVSKRGALAIVPNSTHPTREQILAQINYLKTPILPKDTFRFSRADGHGCLMLSSEAQELTVHVYHFPGLAWEEIGRFSHQPWFPYLAACERKIRDPLAKVIYKQVEALYLANDQEAYFFTNRTIFTHSYETVVDYLAEYRYRRIMAPERHDKSEHPGFHIVELSATEYADYTQFLTLINRGILMMEVNDNMKVVYEAPGTQFLSWPNETALLIVTTDKSSAIEHLNNYATRNEVFLYNLIIDNIEDGDNIVFVLHHRFIPTQRVAEIAGSQFGGLQITHLCYHDNMIYSEVRINMKSREHCIVEYRDSDLFSALHIGQLVQDMENDELYEKHWEPVHNESRRVLEQIEERFHGPLIITPEHFDVYSYSATPRTLIHRVHAPIPRWIKNSKRGLRVCCLAEFMKVTHLTVENIYQLSGVLRHPDEYHLAEFVICPSRSSWFIHVRSPSHESEAISTLDLPLLIEVSYINAFLKKPLTLDDFEAFLTQAKNTPKEEVLQSVEHNSPPAEISGTSQRPKSPESTDVTCLPCTREIDSSRTYVRCVYLNNSVETYHRKCYGRIPTPEDLNSAWLVTGLGDHMKKIRALYTYISPSLSSKSRQQPLTSKSASPSANSSSELPAESTARTSQVIISTTEIIKGKQSTVEIAHPPSELDVERALIALSTPAVPLIREEQTTTTVQKESTKRKRREKDQLTLSLAEWHRVTE